MALEVERLRPHPADERSAAQRGGEGNSLVIALVNNMPDSALETTQAQFARLLNAAAGSSPIRLRLSYLPEVPRGAATREQLASGQYWPIDTLLREPLDALIITGLEPVAPLLKDEPYWDRLGQLVRWAETNTTSSIWSCLAAHAAVEHLDGIHRRRLEYKRSGVFSHSLAPSQPLLEGVNGPVFTPHSRWNELPPDELHSAGYTLLTSSAESGADMFSKQSRSLFVFFQGHPEYEATTLLREYRRDVGRFLRNQQAHYPTLPHEYFSPAALKLLSSFEKRAITARSADLLTEFPFTEIGDSVRNTWSADATRIYRNWLAQLRDMKHKA
jgi:homoserine O-succinyltransferase/O-acetyltransferase